MICFAGGEICAHATLVAVEIHTVDIKRVPWCNAEDFPQVEVAFNSRSRYIIGQMDRLPTLLEIVRCKVSVGSSVS